MCRVDVMALKTYQQLYLYFIPMFTNLGFINTVVVAVRLYWFERRLRETGQTVKPSWAVLPHIYLCICLASSTWTQRYRNGSNRSSRDVERGEGSVDKIDDQQSNQQDNFGSSLTTTQQSSIAKIEATEQNTHITFADRTNPPHNDSKVLHVPGPRERDQGMINIVIDAEDISDSLF